MIMTTAIWLQAHLDDCAACTGQTGAFAAQQLAELKELAALIIAGDY